MTKKIFGIFLILLNLSLAGLAQQSEPVRSSALTGADLPANAERILPGSVPAEVDQVLNKVVAEGNSRVARGATEVIAWGGATYKKATAGQTVRAFQAKLKAKGWQYQAGGEEDGVGFFSLQKDGEPGGLVGFYGITDDALVVAMTELKDPDGDSKTTSTDEPVAAAKPSNGSRSFASLSGTWERKTSGQSYVKPNGVYAGSSGNFESYTFHADGRVDYTSLIAVQNYGCRLEAFSQQKGRASLNGPKLEVALNQGTVRRDDSCSPSKNYTNPLKSTVYSYDWKIEDDGYGNTRLMLTEANGGSFQYRKVK